MFTHFSVKHHLLLEIMGNLTYSNQKSQGANTKVDGHPQIALRPESLLATLATWLRLGLPGTGAGDYNKH